MFCENCGNSKEKDEAYCTECGHYQTSINKRSKSSNKKSLLITGGILVGVVFVGWLLTPTDSTEEPTSETLLDYLEPAIKPVGYFDDMSLFDSETIDTAEWLRHVQYYSPLPEENDTTLLSDNEKLFSSVVKIICEDTDYIYNGSGTNVDPAGYILTNHHVVEKVLEDSCLIGFPNPTTGLIQEAYWATIITDKEETTSHDLAYLAIESPAFDNEGNIYGYYDRIISGNFPFIDYTSDACINKLPELGSSILVLGYPPLSGNALTVTSGLISSLYSQGDYLITSAKIVGGNSGGTAVDESGCFVGVPTAVYSSEDETDELFGEIIDAEFVFDFDVAVEDDLQEYYQEKGITYP